MYSIQALWTAAHHDLAVVFVILNNREYRILEHNMDTYRQRFGAKRERGYPHRDLLRPDLGFVELARGMGVDGARVSAPDELRPAIEKALGARRPFARGLEGESAALTRMRWPYGEVLRVRDREGRLVVLFRSLRDIDYCIEKNSDVTFRRLG
jgi:thiamine pyrophosphate-dependent acetolactate synthase large subunit-like protein